MAETSQQYVFTYKEVAEALIKQQGLHEGSWGLYVEFGVMAGNVKDPAGKLMPAAILPITKLGIQSLKPEHPLAVNAAEINPPEKGSD